MSARFEQSLAKPSPRLILIRLLRGAGDATPAARAGGDVPARAEFHSPHLSLLPIPLARPLPDVFQGFSAAWQGFNTSPTSPVGIPLHPASIPSLPEHSALSTALEKPLGAGMEGTEGPYPANPSPPRSGRWFRVPAAGTSGTGSGGSRCSAGVWAARNLRWRREGLSQNSHRNLSVPLSQNSHRNLRVPLSQNSHRNLFSIILLQTGTSSQLPALGPLTTHQFRCSTGRVVTKTAPHHIWITLTSPPSSLPCLHPPWAGDKPETPSQPPTRAWPAPPGLPRPGLGVHAVLRAWGGAVHSCPDVGPAAGSGRVQLLRTERDGCPWERDIHGIPSLSIGDRRM